MPFNGIFFRLAILLVVFLLGDGFFGVSGFSQTVIQKEKKREPAQVQPKVTVAEAKDICLKQTQVQGQALRKCVKDLLEDSKK